MVVVAVERVGLIVVTEGVYDAGRGNGGGKVV